MVRLPNVGDIYEGGTGTLYKVTHVEDGHVRILSDYTTVQKYTVPAGLRMSFELLNKYFTFKEQASDEVSNPQA